MPDATYTEDEKLSIKRNILKYTRRQNLRYIDYGSWVAIDLNPITTINRKKGAPDAKQQAENNRGTGTK